MLSSGPNMLTSERGTCLGTVLPGGGERLLAAIGVGMPLMLVTARLLPSSARGPARTFMVAACRSFLPANTSWS